MFAKRVARSCHTLTAALIGVALITPLSTAQEDPPEGMTVADLQVVDCLLPGQVRRLGQSRYITARRPILTTAADCRIRGGEYTEYDRADYKSAFAVWMPAAESGDAEAQTNVGEIFEKGFGTEPNYAAAAIWYTKAAEQGDSRALFNLATLYERGLGVEPDKLKALNLYRQAWGIPEDSVIFQTAASQAQAEERKELEALIGKKDKEIQLLQSQIGRLNDLVKSMQEKAASSASADKEELESLEMQVAQLQGMVDNLAEERDEAKMAAAEIPRFREPEAVGAEDRDAINWVDGKGSSKQFGKYYALIIGNSDYRYLNDLETPREDVQKLATLLQTRYGFSVKVLNNADDVQLMHAINDLSNELKEEDNLLIYYAGHGARPEDEFKEKTGYWLPVNANPPPRDTFWIPNEAITRHLGRLKAKRVLVVADSCYSGLLSDSPDYLFLAESDAGLSPEFLEYKLAKRSRLLLSSGGDYPVLDNFGGEFSVFASALLEVLENNERVLSSPELFQAIKPTVQERAAKAGHQQIPEFKTIKVTGNEAGDFFFVPVT